jgi:glycosyltransferase involved in cell wall biosynthesis
MLNWRSLPILNTPMISIVIVTYNSGGIIGGAIESIVNQGYPLNSLELIIVDNGSRDETTDIVKQNIDKYRDKLHISLIDTKKNNGFGKGVNIGIRNASDDAEFILLVNPDCVLYNDTIKELALAASSTMEYGYRLWE